MKKRLFREESAVREQASHPQEDFMNGVVSAMLRSVTQASLGVHQTVRFR